MRLLRGRVRQFGFSVVALAILGSSISAGTASAAPSTTQPTDPSAAGAPQQKQQPKTETWEGGASRLAGEMRPRFYIWSDADGNVTSGDTPPAVVKLDSRGLASVSTAKVDSSAQAKKYGPSVPWICSVYVENAKKSGSWISVKSEQVCSGSGYGPTKADVVLQQYWGVGIWNNKSTGASNWSSQSVTGIKVYYDCSGDGRKTYRGIGRGYANGGAYVSAETFSQYQQEYSCV